MTDRYFAFLDNFLSKNDPVIFAYDIRSNVSLSQIPPGGELVLFASGSDVSVRYVSLQNSSENEVKLAAPFAIENDVGEAVEDLYLALGKKPAGSEGRRAVCVVSTEMIDQWRSAVREKYSGSIRLVAEHCVLADGTAMDIGPRILLRLDGEPLSFDKELPRTVLKSLVGEHKLSLVKPKMPLRELATLFDAADDAVDLFQGKLQARRARGQLNIQLGNRVAVLAAAFSVACFAFFGLEVLAAKNSVRAIEADMQALVRPVFPEQSNVRDPVRSVSRAVAELDQTPRLEFLDASAALYSALGQVPGAQLRGIRYEPDRSGFVAHIAYADFGDDADLSRLLLDLGIETRVGDARQVNGAVLADVTLEVGAR